MDTRRRFSTCPRCQLKAANVWPQSCLIIGQSQTWPSTRRTEGRPRPAGPGGPGGRRPRRCCSYLDAVHDIHLLRLAQGHERHATQPVLTSSARVVPAPTAPPPCVINLRGGRSCRRHRRCRELDGLLLCAAGCLAESREPRRLVPGSHRCSPRPGPRSGTAEGGDGGCGRSLARGLGLGNCLRLHGQLGGGTGARWKSWGEARGAAPGWSRWTQWERRAAQFAPSWS